MECKYAYDRTSHTGKLDSALDEIDRHGWTVVDMTRDWMMIYPFELLIVNNIRGCLV